MWLTFSLFIVILILLGVISLLSGVVLRLQIEKTALEDDLYQVRLAARIAYGMSK